MSKKTSKVISRRRVASIDFLRGAAVFLMIIYHLIYDLIQLGGVPPFVHKDFYHYGPHIISGLFMFVVGISLVEYDRANKGKANFNQVLKKGRKVFAWGIFLSLITALLSFLSSMKVVVLFGILHCIGISIILSYPFLRLKLKVVFLISILILCLGFTLEAKGYHYRLFLFLRDDVLPIGYKMPDFFPLIPWWGFLLLGIYFARTSFGRLSIANSYFVEGWFINKIKFLGRHSLFIYLVHQPILLSGIYLANLLRFLVG